MDTCEEGLGVLVIDFCIEVIGILLELLRGGSGLHGLDRFFGDLGDFFEEGTAVVVRLKDGSVRSGARWKATPVLVDGESGGWLAELALAAKHGLTCIRTREAWEPVLGGLGGILLVYLNSQLSTLSSTLNSF